MARLQLGSYCLGLLLLASIGCQRGTTQPAGQTPAEEQVQAGQQAGKEAHQKATPPPKNKRTVYESKSVSDWIALLKDKDARSRQRATAALTRIGAPAVSDLADALKDTDSSVREAAAQVLGEIGPKAKRTVPQLLKGIEDQDIPARISAALALARVSPANVKDAVNTLGRIVHPVWAVERHNLAAAIALGEIGKDAKSAADGVAKVVVFSTGADRESAVAALKKIDEGMVKDALEQAKQRDTVWGKILAKEPPAVEKTPKEKGGEKAPKGGNKANEKTAIAAIKKLGGVVRFDEDDPKKPVSVGLQGVKLTDTDMERLAALPSLKTLVLKRASFSTAGLKVVAKLKSLEWLDLMDTSLGDDALKHLEGLAGLKELDLGLNPKLTDAGMASIGKFKKLEGLNLAASKVTDKGLAKLEGLKKLKYLNLTGAKVTRKGIEKMELAIPGIGIISTARE